MLGDLLILKLVPRHNPASLRFTLLNDFFVILERLLYNLSLPSMCDRNRLQTDLTSLTGRVSLRIVVQIVMPVAATQFVFGLLQHFVLVLVAVLITNNYNLRQRSLLLEQGTQLPNFLPFSFFLVLVEVSLVVSKLLLIDAVLIV